MTLYKPFDGSRRKEFEAHVPKEEDFLLCHNCGWNASTQLHTAYASHVKCKPSSSRGLWFVGDKYVLKERSLYDWGLEDYVGTEYSITKFLSENTTIPVPKIISYWKDSTSHFMLMERMPGETLAVALDEDHIDDSQLRTIMKEVVEYLVQLRKFTSTRIEDPDGLPIRDVLLGSLHNKVVFMTEDVDEWWARTEPRLKNNPSEEWKKDFKEQYPVKGGPYVLTHGDLDPTNIMVKDGHVSGLIDWERGGYLPEWWEAIATDHIPYPPRGTLLRQMEKQIGPFPDQIKKFFRKYECNVADYPRVQVMPRPDRDPWRYMVCTNFRRYHEEFTAGYRKTVDKLDKLEQEAKQAAKQALGGG
ncbi:hypothetical protein EAF04_002513 [Stromatinia cepivora]|nr:hypothetical protein EAF04_002513 [Stromatinia cepivora]